MASDRRVALGQTGEELACQALCGRGYEILERRFRTRHGEIDIIARDGPTLVFVEVKLRAGSSFGLPAESVTGAKRRRLGLIALAYLGLRRVAPSPCRFDVVSVTLIDGRPQIDVVEGAFEVDDQ